MKKFYLVLLSVIFAISGLFAQDCTELFISEYVEGTANSKALEIYNPTDQIVDLGQYWVARYSNGASSYDAGGITHLQGFLQSKDVFILVNGQTEDLPNSTKCAPELQAKADMLDHAYPAPTYMNGNDAIALFKDPVGAGEPADFIPVDLFGTIGGGMQPTDLGWTNFTDKWTLKNIYDANNELIGRDSIFIQNYIVPDGYYWLPWTSDHTLIRKASVKKGVTEIPAVFNVTTEWDSLSVNNWSNLGVHDCYCSWKTGIKNTDEISRIQLYPNPVSEGNFTITAYKPAIQIETINSLGQVVKSHFTGLNTRQVNVILDESFEGLLIVRIKFSDMETITQKLMVR